MPIGLIASPDRLSPAAKFERQRSGKGRPEDTVPGKGAHQAVSLKAAAAREEAGTDLIAAFIANETVLPSPTKRRPAQAAVTAGDSCLPAEAGKGSSAAAAPLEAAEPSSGGSTAQVEVMCVDASLSAAPTSLAAAPTTLPAVTAAAKSPPASQQATPTAASHLMASTLDPALAGMGGHPMSSPAVPLPPAHAPLPQASTTTAADPNTGAPPLSLRSLSKRFSRSMRKMGASLRQRLRRQDSPPVPRSLSRALGIGCASRRSSAAAATHMPSIAEGAAPTPAALAVAPIAAAPVVVVAAGDVAGATGDVAGGSMEEVELGLPAAAATSAHGPPRRFASLRFASCPCFAGPMQ